MEVESICSSVILDEALRHPDLRKLSRMVCTQFLKFLFKFFWFLIHSTSSYAQKGNSQY